MNMKLFGLNGLGRYIEEERVRKEIRLSELASLVGYRNISKGVNRSHRFESEGIVGEDLLARIAEVLEIPRSKIDELKELERQENYRRFDECVAQSDPPHLIIRLIPGVYRREWVPSSVPTVQLEHYAAAKALETQKQT